MSKDINELLNSIVSSTGKWYENVSTEVQEFLDAIEQLIINNKQVNAVKISDILDAEYGLSITPTSVRTWLKELKKK
jgi:transposase|tara:strand:+ start:523 stop:753 length:231 start_codon:yes stop_codon:yes gene_type:complete